jgi:energy-coupling factor transport system permease protein
MLFTAKTLTALIPGIIFMIVGYMASKIPFSLMLKSLKPIIPIIIFTSILNLFFLDGIVIFRLWIIKITYDGVLYTGMMIIRIIALIAGSSLLTYTTSPIALTDAIESLLSPLKKIKFPVHELAMMMSIALRFIPTLIEETDKIMSAQKARGADMESGGLIHRAKALTPILVPLFVSAFSRAMELATAMECRCYRGGEGRTRLKQLTSSGRDYLTTSFTLVFLNIVLLLNVYAAG